MKHKELKLIMGIRGTAPITRIGEYNLVLNNEVSSSLFNCFCSPNIAQNIILFHALYKDRFRFAFDKEIGDILVCKLVLLFLNPFLVMVFMRVLFM